MRGGPPPLGLTAEGKTGSSLPAEAAAALPGSHRPSLGAGRCPRGSPSRSMEEGPEPKVVDVPSESVLPQVEQPQLLLISRCPLPGHPPLDTCLQPRCHCLPVGASPEQLSHPSLRLSRLSEALAINSHGLGVLDPGGCHLLPDGPDRGRRGSHAHAHLRARDK